VDNGCWLLLTQDCSQQSLFAVYTKSGSDGGRVFQLLVPMYEIELTVHSRGAVRITVDNEEKLFDQQSRSVLIKDERDDDAG